MNTNIVFRSFILFVIFALSPLNIFAEEQGDIFNSFESILKMADLIIKAQVIDTNITSEEVRGETHIVRYTKLNIEDTISNSIGYDNKTITIKTIDQKIYKGKNRSIGFVRKPEIDERYILLLDERENQYYPLYSTCGFIPLSGKKLKNTDEDISSYIDEIRDVVYQGYH